MLEELIKASEQNPGDTQYDCQKAYCLILGKYCDATADVKKSHEFSPNNFSPPLRKGHVNTVGEKTNYASALESFAEGQKLVRM